MESGAAYEGLQQSDRQLEDAQEMPQKKKYVTPHLIEYGSFGKLTRNGGVGGGDAMLSSPCL